MKPKLVVVDAGDEWTRSLFSELAASFDILLVKLPTPRAFSRGNGLLFSRVEWLRDGVQALTVPMPPRYLTVTWPLAKWLIVRAICKAGFGAPDVLAISYPYYTVLIDELGAKRSLYYVYDEYSRFWPSRAADVLRREADLIAKADVTITVSKFNTDRLKDVYPDRADAIHHVPNGVNPKFFADKLMDAVLPDALATIPSPRAGYIGSLNFRFDFAFLAEVAAQRPDVSFVLGGKYTHPLPDDPAWQAGFARAQFLPNIHFIGEVPHEQLGPYWKHFDVFLIPYTKCLFNDVACPLKLWDYMGQGGPIVANTTNPEILLWSDYVNVYATPEEFAKGIDDALIEGKSRADELIAVASAHSWDKIAMRVEDLLR